MIWTSWRQQRLQLITLLGLLVVGAGVIALLRSNMIDDITTAKLTSCVTAVEQCSAPDGAVKAFREAWGDVFEMGRILIICLPALIGVFVGAPLFARELEQGTHVLAFTQSVSRTRWMFSKLVVALVPALILLIALQSLVLWWVHAAGVLGPWDNGPFYAINFAIDHVSPAGYALFAFALSAFLGVVSRRTLVAMVSGLGAFVVVRLALSGLVKSLVPTQRLESPASTQLPLDRTSDLVLEHGYLDTAGQPVSHDRFLAVSQACKTTPQGEGTAESQQEYLACFPKSGLAKEYADIIPESHAWQVHLADAAIFGTLAVLLVAGTVWVLRRQS